MTAARARGSRSAAVPRLTVRLRLTLTYASLFAVAALILLAVSYALVAASLKSLPVTPAQYLSLVHGLPTPPVLPAFPLRDLLEGVRNALASRSLHRLELDYSIAFGATLAASVAVGWWIAGRILRPIARITQTARRVSARTLSERIALGGADDELRELADTFDGMLDRLEATFDSQQRFIANASHELRTPLAVILAEVDVALSDPQVTHRELQSTREVVRQAVQRSERMIDGLLALARSDAGGLSAREPMALDRRVREYLAIGAGRAADRGLRIDTCALEPAVASGEPELLERVVDNLMENAIRHNTDGGRVRIATRIEGDQAVLCVANGGPVIPDRDLARLTEPFQRLERTRAREGSGIGLSIVKAVVHLHGGTLTLSSPPTGGLVVEVRVPATNQRQRC